MKKIIVVIIIIIVFSQAGINQQWQYIEDFIYGDEPHGLVVTPDEKIWIGYYSKTDSLITTSGDTILIKPIWIYNPDGTLHTKIKFLTHNGITDTIFYGCRGLSLDNNGNVLFSISNTLWRINYQTYQAENKVIPTGNKSLTEAACDDNGFIYVTHIVPTGLPVYIYDSNFQFFNSVIDTSLSISRSLLVSPDGNDVFLGRMYGGSWGNGIIHFHSDNGPNGVYTVVDTLHKEIWAGQSLDWDKDGFLWAGSYFDVGPGDIDGWYKIDPSQNFSIIDSIGQNAGSPIGTIPPAGATFYSPRGVAWSADKSTMYTADFDGGVIKKWFNPYVNVQDIEISIPTLTANNNDTLLVPINVIFPYDSNYTSCNLIISGYQDEIDLIDIITDSSLFGNAGWNVQWNDTNHLEINATADTVGINGMGSLLWMKFYLPDTINVGYVPLNFEYVAFNSDSSNIQTSSGVIQIIMSNIVYGDVDTNGTVQAYDAALVLKHIVGLIQLSPQQLQIANVSLDSTISALDASYILQYLVGLIPSLPYLPGNNLNASGIIQIDNIIILPEQIVEIPMELSGGQDIISFQGEVNYNPNHLKFINNDPGPVFADFTYEISNDSATGIIKFCGSNSTPSNYNDLFMTMNFKVANDFNSDSTTIYLQNFKWNEEEIISNVAKTVLYLLTGINNENNNLPSTFNLYQNYPNPFNPGSTIRYDLPKRSNVRLEIYDITSRKVRTLINQSQSAGEKSVIWDSKNEFGQKVASGLYIYKLVAGDYVKSRKMLLLK